MRRSMAILLVCSSTFVPVADAAQEIRAPYDRAVAMCGIDPVFIPTQPCPAREQRWTSAAEADGAADALTGAVSVSASARGHPRLPSLFRKEASAWSIVSTSLDAAEAGSVRVLIEDLSLSEEVACDRCVRSLLGDAVADVSILVQIMREHPSGFTTESWTHCETTGSVPATLVIPDDCPEQGSLLVPAGAGVYIDVILMAEAGATGRGTATAAARARVAAITITP